MEVDKKIVVASSKGLLSVSVHDSLSDTRETLGAPRARRSRRAAARWARGTSSCCPADTGARPRSRSAGRPRSSGCWMFTNARFGLRQSK